MLSALALAVAAAATAPSPADAHAAVFAALRPVQEKIVTHWHPLCDPAQSTRFKVRLRLDESGKLLGTPTILAHANPSPENERAALDAITEAAPFGPLPAHDIVLNFDTAQRCARNDASH